MRPQVSVVRVGAGFKRAGIEPLDESRHLRRAIQIEGRNAEVFAAVVVLAAFAGSGVIGVPDMDVHAVGMQDDFAQNGIPALVGTDIVSPFGQACVLRSLFQKRLPLTVESVLVFGVANVVQIENDGRHDGIQKGGGSLSGFYHKSLALSSPFPNCGKLVKCQRGAIIASRPGLSSGNYKKIPFGILCGKLWVTEFPCPAWYTKFQTWPLPLPWPFYGRCSE